MKAFSLLIIGLSARTITIEIPDSPVDMMMGNPLGMMGMMNSPIFGQAAMLADMKRMEQLMESEMAAMQGIEGTQSQQSFQSYSSTSSSDGTSAKKVIS